MSRWAAVRCAGPSTDRSDGGAAIAPSNIRTIRVRCTIALAVCWVLCSAWAPRALAQDGVLASLRQLPSGKVRADAISLALSRGEQHWPEGAWFELQTLAYEAFLQETDGYAALPAIALAESMYQHAPAAWSGLCLEGISRRAGSMLQAGAVLRELLDQASTPQEHRDLIERQAIYAAGAGLHSLEVHSLGRAVALGGGDALQILGQKALNAGDLQTARDLFRVLVDRSRDNSPSPPEPPPWCLRGWGLTLLPPGSSTLHEPITANLRPKLESHNDSSSPRQ